MSVLLAGMAILLCLPPLGEAEAQSAPQVTQVWRSGTTQSSATFGLDHVLAISVQFDQPVEVRGHRSSWWRSDHRSEI